MPNTPMPRSMTTTLAPAQANALNDTDLNDDALLPAETDALAQYERVIERGMNTYLAVGEALLAIKIDRLYRATHATFDDYCQERWGFGKRHADRTIAAAKVTRDLTETRPIGLKALPVNEAQARPLTALETPTERADAWDRAVEAAQGQPTAAQVQDAVDDVQAVNKMRSIDPKPMSQRGPTAAPLAELLPNGNKLLTTSCPRLNADAPLEEALHFQMEAEVLREKLKQAQEAINDALIFIACMKRNGKCSDEAEQSPIKDLMHELLLFRDTTRGFDFSAEVQH